VSGVTRGKTVFVFVFREAILVACARCCGGGGGDSRTLCVYSYLFMWVSCQMGRKAYFSLSFCARSARRKEASLL
jgi:hypothetical protein